MNRQVADPKVTIQEITEDPNDGSAVEFILVIEDDNSDGSSQLTEELRKIAEHLEDDVRLDQELDDLQEGLTRLSQVLTDSDSVTSQRNADLWPKMLAQKSNFHLHCCAICAQPFEDLSALQSHASNRLHSSARLNKFYLFDCKLCTTSPPFSKPTLILDHIRSAHNELTDENGVGTTFDKISVIQMHSANPNGLVKRIKTLGNGVLLPPNPFKSSGQSRLKPKKKPATSMPATSVTAKLVVGTSWPTTSVVGTSLAATSVAATSMAATSVAATSMAATSMTVTSVPTKSADQFEAERLRKSIASLGHTKIMSNIKKLIKNVAAPTPPSNDKKITVADFARMTAPSSQEMEVEMFNEISEKDISPKRKWVINGIRTVSHPVGQKESNHPQTSDSDVPKLNKSNANVPDELIDHSVELFSDYYEPHDEVTVVEEEPSAKKIRRQSLQEKVVSKERKSVESSSKQHREETSVTIKIEKEKGFFKLSSLIPDRSNSVHNVTLNCPNGVTKKQCENLKRRSSECGQFQGLEEGVASNENPPSGAVTSSTKCDPDSNQTLLPQKKQSFFHAENNSVVAV